MTDPLEELKEEAEAAANNFRHANEWHPSAAETVMLIERLQKLECWASRMGYAWTDTQAH